MKPAPQVALARYVGAAGRRFGVSPSCAIKLVRRWRETGCYGPGQVGGQKKRKLAGHEDWLHEVMTSQPDITLGELRERLAAKGIEISRQSIDDTLRRRGPAPPRARLFL